MLLEKLTMKKYRKKRITEQDLILTNKKEQVGYMKMKMTNTFKEVAIKNQVSNNNKLWSYQIYIIKFKKIYYEKSREKSDKSIFRDHEKYFEVL